ncbi:MAG: hypothetical protein FWE05_11630 [Defluviitaleaceae bacterium]|nr:hypothetical protein [Defluviitaleaceae bacterium]
MQLSEYNRRTTHNSGAAVYGFNIWRKKGGNENRRLHIERRRGCNPCGKQQPAAGLFRRGV